MKAFRPIFLGLAAAALGANLALLPVQAQSIEETECRLGAPGISRILARCSTLEVPENPAEPSGPTIRLAVARIPALAATPVADPLVLIQGGPGGSSIDLYLQLRGALTGIRRSRDIIVMDQRGTGRSINGMSCDAPQDMDYQTADAQLLNELIVDCIGKLSADPRYYTTSIAVADLERLRESYGFAEWNIYGVSYGTRVAQHYLRRYPERVRSVVLDGSVAPDLVLGPDIAIATQDTLDAIFARCTESSACNARFGDLEEKFRELRERLEEGNVSVIRSNPASGETEEVDISIAYLLGLTRFLSYSSATAALLPLTIHDAHDGRYGTLLAQSEMIFGGVERSMNFPMHNTVICSEDVVRLEGDAEDFGAGTYLGSQMIEALEAICSRWPVGPVDPDFHELIVSDRPVLFLSGSNDPATPARYVDTIISGGLSNSRHIVVEDQGHGVFAIGCIPQLVEAFLESASAAGMDTSCVDRVLPVPFFLTPAGPGP